MNITKLPNGNLAMIALANTRQELKKWLTLDDGTTMLALESQFISDYLGGDPMGDGISYEQVAPEEVGALTSAPLISDGTNIYGFMYYQVLSLLEELANGKEVIWRKG